MQCTSKLPACLWSKYILTKLGLLWGIRQILFKECRKNDWKLVFEEFLKCHLTSIYPKSKIGCFHISIRNFPNVGNASGWLLGNTSKGTEFGCAF